MKLNTLAPKITKKARLRRGQGNSAGQGTFAGRGCKGQNSRAGGGVRLGFEGGQTPLVQRMPKMRGFKNPNKVSAQVVKLAALEEKFKAGDTVNVETLLNAGLIDKNNAKVKILSEGELTKKLTVSGVLISKTAQGAVEKAGGKVEDVVSSTQQEEKK